MWEGVGQDSVEGVQAVFSFSCSLTLLRYTPPPTISSRAIDDESQGCAAAA